VPGDAAPSNPVPNQAAAAGEPVPPSPVPPSPVATVAVGIDSAPSRAELYRWPSEVKVGATPWRGELERADGVAVFVVKKRGYADRRIEVDLRTSTMTQVTLTPATPARPTSRPPASRHKGEPADPFQGHLE
jgi:hypothetical protein